MNLTTIAPADYVRDILPQSRAIWAEGRSFDQYVADFVALSASSFGKKRFRTLGLKIDGTIVASCKRYEREVRCGESVFRAAGIGAVFTQPHVRGRGFASAMLGALLDRERAAGVDLAYLFSDIHPSFYERLGFSALPSRSISLRADALPANRITIGAVEDGDWSAIRRCFDALDHRRPLAFRRTPQIWEWLRLRTSADRNDPARVALLVRASRGATAYVMGRRLPKLDAFALDEFGYTGDDGFDAVGSLLRSATGDLRRITGWLPPDIARRAIPRGTVRKRKTAILMIVPLSQSARASWRHQAAAIRADDADRCWSTDHI